MPLDSTTLLKKNEPLVFPCPDMQKQAGIWWEQAIAIDAAHQASLAITKTSATVLKTK